MHETHTRVFTVAKITKIDLLNDIQSSLEDAYKKGQSFEAWQENIKPVLAKKGWLGDVSVTNPQAGEAKQIYVGSRRLKRIFETNMRVSFARARYESQMSSPFEYFRYVAILDRRTRASHAKLHGLILPKTHKFWQKNYPPNDWGCRCKVQVVSEYEIKQKGYKISQSAPGSIASKDWAYNPGKSAHSLDSVLAKKAANLSGELKNIVKNDLKNYERDRNLYVWQKGLDDMVDYLASGNIIKEKIYQIAQIGILTKSIKNSLKRLNITPKAASIAIYQDTILHIMRDSKPQVKKPNLGEIKASVSVLDKSKHCFYDTKHKNIIFFYPSMQDDNMSNYVVVNLDYTIKKFRTDNFVATISKMPLKSFKSILKNKKQYIKLK